jgi:hypothetical protein
MVAQVNNKSDPATEKSQLSIQDTRLLIVMCTELVNLCARLTGKIDPAAAAMLAYVRDDIVAESKIELQMSGRVRKSRSSRPQSQQSDIK